MEIPVLTNFIEGLKLFFASKRLKWITLIFFIGAISIYLLERIVATWFPGAGALLTLVGAIFPFFFMLTTFVALLGFQRFVASDESYRRSLIFTIIWIIVSIVLFIPTVMLLVGFLLILVFAGFFLWIGFQAYFSTRTSLSIAKSVDIDHRSKFMTFLMWMSNVFNYMILAGAFVVTAFILHPGPSIPQIVLALAGLLVAVIFNLINGLLITKERNKSTSDNLAMLGLFVAIYSGYFIYNILKPVDLGVDIIGLVITIFFLLYTMSGVGRSLASRAELDTRWKLSKESAATFTFFLASCYVFVDVTFTAILLAAGWDASNLASVSDALKLIIFPFVALVMELDYLRKAGKVLAIPDTPDDLPVVPVEEIVYDASGEVVEEESTTYDEPSATPAEEVVEPEADYSDEPSEAEVEDDFSEDEEDFED
ncbi:MAG: hypothetical protein P1Q69_13295 [Candidatus Thorarchaeota archaeon]|nr:hypothetical protein [Candidatus Thorarchaeota archaeon]